MSAAIEVRRLSYSYPDGRPALDDVTLRVERGERVALLGVNGSGKTTLLLNMLGLLAPQAGELLLFGESVRRDTAGLKRLRSRVGLVFQNPDSQLLSASVAEDVSFGPLNLGLEVAEVRERVAAALDAVGMTPHSDVPVHALSFGQKKRVCIAGVLAMRPDVVLLDEPTAGLDARALDGLLRVLEGLHSRGMTIVMATHDVDLAYAWADRAEVLESGRVAASFGASEFPEAFPALAPSGLPVPRVAEAYAAALRGGLAPIPVPPRTHEELLEALSRQDATAPVPLPLAEPVEEAS